MASRSTRAAAVVACTAIIIALLFGTMDIATAAAPPAADYAATAMDSYSSILAASQVHSSPQHCFPISLIAFDVKWRR